MRHIHRMNGEYTPKTCCNIFGVDDAAVATIGAAAIGAGASAAGQASLNKKTREFNREEAEKQRAWSEKMYNEQNAWNYRMWQEQNEYNTPEAQVQRMREAGLNPLYYGLDGSSAGDLSAAQALGYQRADAGNQLNPLAGFAELPSTIAQIAQTQAQTNLIKSQMKVIDAKLPFEVANLKAQVRNSNLSSDAQEIINNYLDRQQEAELRVKGATVAQADAVVKKAVAEIDKMDYEKTTMFIGWLETNEKIHNLQKQRELTDKQMEELESLIKVNNATAGKIGLDISNYDDITVIGTASTTMKVGPVTVQEGEPITLGMKKAADAHRKQLEEEQKAKQKNKSTKNQSYGATTAGSGYEGPIYD